MIVFLNIDPTSTLNLAIDGSLENIYKVREDYIKLGFNLEAVFPLFSSQQA